MISFKTIKTFIKKEFRQVLRNRIMCAMLFGAPLIQLVIFGLAISTEIKNIDLFFVHSPADKAAVGLERSLYSSSDWFNKVDYDGNSDPYKMIVSGKADAVLIAPKEGLGKSIEKGEGRLQLLADASNANTGRVIETYITSIVNKHFAKENKTAPNFSFDTRVLYNPEIKSSFFMVPAVMAMVVAIVTIMLTSMSIVKEKESGTFENIISASLTNMEIMLGKSIPFVILGLIVWTLVFTAAYLFFGIPVRGPLWQLITSSFFYVLCTVSVGILISTIASTQQQAMMGSFMTLMPFIILSGVIFPIENMPSSVIAVAYADPVMYYVRLLRSVMLRGGDTHVFIVNAGALLLLSVALSVVAYMRFRQTLN